MKRLFRVKEINEFSKTVERMQLMLEEIRELQMRHHRLALRMAMSDGGSLKGHGD